MAVKVTGQFEPAGSFAIVDGKDISGNITGSQISASGTIYAADLILSGGLGVFTSASLAAGGGGGGSGTVTSIVAGDGLNG